MANVFSNARHNGELLGFKALYCDGGVSFYCGLKDAFPQPAELDAIAAAGLCILHLTRRNRVAQAISRQGAMARQKTYNITPSAANHCRPPKCAGRNSSFLLPYPERLPNQLRQQVGEHEAIAKRLAEHENLRSMHIVYEELTECFKAPLRFLGVRSNVTLSAQFLKDHTARPSELLDNFDAVAHALASTEFMSDLTRLESGLDMKTSSTAKVLDC